MTSTTEQIFNLPVGWRYKWPQGTRAQLSDDPAFIERVRHECTVDPVYLHPIAAPGEATPAARWRVEGQPDPHAEQYDGDRAALCMGNLSDDELANAVFMYGNAPLNIAEAMAGKPQAISYLQAAKDRIRWLSRKLHQALTMPPARSTEWLSIPVTLDDEVRWILGRPSFECAPVAEYLRKRGHEIKRKAEAEQAAVIHWLLQVYVMHGDAWRKHIFEDLPTAAPEVSS